MSTSSLSNDNKATRKTKQLMTDITSEIKLRILHKRQSSHAKFRVLIPVYPKAVKTQDDEYGFVKSIYNLVNTDYRKASKPAQNLVLKYYSTRTKGQVITAYLAGSLVLLLNSRCHVVYLKVMLPKVFSVLKGVVITPYKIRKQIQKW
ncbi:hypothetical protein EDC96DRAFT_545331 [Choanephora cucurbitarum]|nr:hypothetical protein EDC96DRAFT_545331 [Choanephora cucurbitarum]